MYNFSKVLSPEFMAVIGLGIVCFLLAGLTLFRDFKQMQRERQEGIAFVWYRRPGIVAGLRWLGCSLLILPGTYLVLLPLGYPSMIFISVLAGITYSFVIHKLIIEARKRQRESQEGDLTTWYRRWEFSRWMILACFLFGSLMVLGVTSFLLMQGASPPSFLTPADLVVYLALFVITFILSIAFLAVYALGDR